MVFDHGRDRLVADQRRAERAQAETSAVARLDEAERGSSRQQAFGCHEREAEPPRQRDAGLRAFGQDLERTQAHTGQQHLGIDEPCHKIEQGTRTLPRDRPGEESARGTALEGRAGEHAVAPGTPLGAQAGVPGDRDVAGRGGQWHVDHEVGGNAE